MAKEQQKITPKGSVKTPQRKKFWITLAIILGLPLFLLGVWEIGYQLGANELKAVNQQIWNDAIKPAGGVTEKPTSVYAAHVWHICIDDGPCPRVTDSWFVLVKPGSEADYLYSVLQKSGYATGHGDIYTRSKMLTGGKGNTSITIELSPLDGRQPPYAAPAGENWQILNATTYKVGR